jgi:hypothetical protein
MDHRLTENGATEVSVAAVADDDTARGEISEGTNAIPGEKTFACPAGTDSTLPPQGPSQALSRSIVALAVDDNF